MPLPTADTPWPPPQWARHYAEMQRADAWYSGEHRRLDAERGAGRPAERRRLWGRRATAQRPRPDRLHVPLAGDIAAMSGTILFADMPAVTLPNADQVTRDRLAVLLDEGSVHLALLAAAEQAAALGGIYLRVTWDRDMVPDRPLLTAVQPDAAVPEFRWGMLRAVTFWAELPGSTSATVYRHLERHESGRIMHGLYQGTADRLGRSVPLTEHPDTADLARSLDRDGDGQTISTRIPQLTAAYVPNQLSRTHRGSPIGRSDYDAPIYDQLDALDTTWTSWMRDLRLARSRLIAPDAYLRDLGPGNGASFDDDREVWTGLRIPPTEAGAGITLAQFTIRVAEHAQTADALTRQAVTSAGYSPQSLGLAVEGGPPVTATEVEDRTSRSMTTRGAKAGFWRQPLAGILGALLAVDREIIGTRITPDRPTVEFGSGVAESMQSTATTLDLLTRAQAVSTATRVKILHPDWDEGAVEAEVAAILRETGAAAPDPVGSFPM
ncbi:phage capsid protein [Streptomyces sp. NRRL F-5630]|uniref:phage capsid protein n=1 Tax=Streptomyces sp. NRRL F-5630 TaxID=1463864 RepID=UPI003EBA8245